VFHARGDGSPGGGHVKVDWTVAVVRRGKGVGSSVPAPPLQVRYAGLIAESALIAWRSPGVVDVAAAHNESVMGAV
jgi:hypothetical protein